MLSLPNGWKTTVIGIAAILCNGSDYFNVFPPAIDQYLSLLCSALIGMGFIAAADHQKKLLLLLACVVITGCSTAANQQIHQDLTMLEQQVCAIQPEIQQLVTFTGRMLPLAPPGPDTQAAAAALTILSPVVAEITQDCARKQSQTRSSATTPARP